jgi:small-conductance mechanosensitive channel/CRP-like cAMP-binding protein
MTTSLALLTVAVVLRAVSRNRHVRGRLFASALAFAIHAVIAGTLTYGAVSTALREQLLVVAPLLLVFGVINALVAIAINPWRVDRLPDRFPTIVQDAIVIVLFTMAVTFMLQERVFTLTAAGAVVIGFALQDTLGNLFAGLAIQIEKPFQVGHWVNLAGTDGLVSEITWRATKIRTKAGNFVIVPNSALARDTIINYSEPTQDTMIEVDVGASYDAAPNQVKKTILAAVRNNPMIRSSQPPEVLLVDFAASSIVYRIRVWTTDFGADMRVRDRVRTAIYYAFRREGIDIPYPIQVEIPGETGSGPAVDLGMIEDTLRHVSIFGALDSETVAQLARAARHVQYAADETIVNQGDQGASMFVVMKGEAVVTLEPSGREVARLGTHGFFGEMSLLTGAARTATVRSVSDSSLLEITADAFRSFVLANPTAVEHIGGAVATRATELEQHRAADANSLALQTPHTFVMRVRRFLGLLPN